MDLVSSTRPIRPAQMIRPTSLVYWNYLKGAADEFSRVLQSLAYTNHSENPIVSIIGRLICAQINSAAIVHRLSVAKAKDLLPEPDAIHELSLNGYSELRHNVTKCETFTAFARGLAKEFNTYFS